MLSSMLHRFALTGVWAGAGFGLAYWDTSSNTLVREADEAVDCRWLPVAQQLEARQHMEALSLSTWR